MELSDKARLVLKNRISRRDQDGNPYEEPEDIFKRVDEALQGNGKYYDLMASQRFMPNSPTLVNAGTPSGQLSACFVLPIGDSIDDIYDSVKNAAKIHKTGGGTGFSFSKLRPEDSVVRSTGGVASGPVSFMKVFDASTEAIKQGGVRRGANMGILNVHHPDILDFVDLKSDGDTLSNFNISVAVTEEFMKALDNDTNYKLYNTHMGGGNLELPAREVWSSIVENAHKTGDPGVIFVDKINSSNANPLLGRYIEATNPCGEQPLYDHDSCNLGSINVSKYIDATGTIDALSLEDDVYTAVEMLNSVIDNNTYPLDEITRTSKNLRRIGLGVMGWADALINSGITYGSEESYHSARTLMSLIQMFANDASRDLGRKYGSFPLVDESYYKGTDMLNSTRTTIAPTGTISMIADCSSGIEPLFDFVFKRSHYLDVDNPNERYEFVDINENFAKEMRKVHGNFPDEDLYDRYYKDGKFGLPEYFVRTNDVDWRDHVKMQAAFQHYTDNAVSKTINLPQSATVEDIKGAYELAYELGCLGITVYRDGSKDQQVLTHTSDSSRSEPEGPVTVSSKNRMPAERESLTHKVSILGEEFYITAGFFESGSVGEVFIIGSKVGSTTRGYLDTIGTLISLALQRGETVQDLYEKFSGVRYEPAGITSNSEIPVCTSLMDYVVRWLYMVEDRDEAPYHTDGNLCPECDGKMFYAEGCSTCGACGYSKCG